MKTDKTKNWTDSWKEQLDEYSVTPPPEVWEELSKELAPRRIPLRKRTIWWAAACITLLLCTFIGLQFLRPTTDLNNLPLQTKISGSEQMEVSRMQNTVPSIKQEPLDIIAQSYKPIRAPQTPDHTDVENHTPSQINESRHIEQPESSEPEKSTPGKKRNNAQTSLFPSRNENTSTTTIHTHTQPKTKPKSTWSLGVSLGNNLIASADNRNGFSNLAPYASAEMASLPSEKNLSNSEGPVTTPYQHIMLQNINSQPKTDIKHHFPVSVGITVQKELNNRLALETGLVYTYLSSDLTAGGTAYYTQNQQLHYLGIPLKLNWNFLKKRYFNLYLSGGGMLEKCVHGELSAQYEMNNRPPFSNDETLHINQLQWSVSASAGISFKLASHISLYAEPVSSITSTMDRTFRLFVKKNPLTSICKPDFDSISEFPLDFYTSLQTKHSNLHTVEKVEYRQSSFLFKNE